MDSKRNVRIWKSLDPDEVSGPKDCPEAITRYLKDHSRWSSSANTDLKRHLFFLGWKIEFIPKNGSVAFRYVSPVGKTFDSLLNVCRGFTGHCRMDSGKKTARFVDSDGDGDIDYDPRRDFREQCRRGKAERFDDSSDDDTGAHVPRRKQRDSVACRRQLSSTSRPCDRVKAEVCPKAVIDWYMISVRRNTVKSEVKEKALGHLLATGWDIFYIQKNIVKRELRYKSPSGKVFISLRTACKSLIDQGKGGLFDSQKRVKTGETDNADGALSGVSKVRRGKDIAFMKKQREGSKRRKTANGVQKSSQKVPQTMVSASSSHRNPRTILSWLIDNDIVLPRDKVFYNAGNESRRVPSAWGRISRQGIKCDCCSQVFTLSRFEAHARSTKHRPAANIYLENGKSLLDCQKQLNQMKSLVKSQQCLEVNHKGCASNSEPDQSDSICSVCHFGGELIMCDHCPAVFHVSCLNLKNTPFGDWFCPSCCCGICGQGRYENVEIGISSDTHSDNELLNCLQCEQNFHIGCLRSFQGMDGFVQNVDRENWFCTRKCENIHMGLRKLIGKQIPVGEDNLTWTLLKCSQNPEAAADTEALFENHSKLNVALNVMHECFHPVKEPFTQNDLVEDVIFSRKSELKRLNFKGFYTVLLERNDEIISVATVRIYGEKVAEVPLVATRFQHRRLGMCRTLMVELEAQLINLGVEKLTLPAVSSVLNTWTGAFGFSKMTESDRYQLLKYTFLNFQDTIMCQKLLINTPCIEWRPHKRVKLTVCGSDITDAMDYDGWSSISDLSDQTYVLD